MKAVVSIYLEFNFGTLNSEFAILTYIGLNHNREIGSWNCDSKISFRILDRNREFGFLGYIIIT